MRTSVFRLAREGWLKATPVGRRSLYRLTRDGARRFEQAYRRIYAPPVEGWDDTWELVIADGSTARAAARARAGAAVGRLRHARARASTRGPRRRRRPSRASPRRSASRGDIVVVRARDDADARRAARSPPSCRGAWDLAGLAADYRRFLLRFGSVIERFRVAGQAAHDPAQAFIVRTLLIHAYRRVLLRDPQLPAALLPLDWPGAAAYALCRDFYRLTHRAAERHLLATLEDARGACRRRRPRSTAASAGWPGEEWASLEPQADVDAAWAVEIEQRVSQLEMGAVEAVPARNRHRRAAQQVRVMEIRLHPA